MFRIFCAIFSSGNFSLFAVFLFSKWHFQSMWTTLLTEGLITSRIPDKIKVIIAPTPMSVPEPAPETLLVTPRFTDEGFVTVALEILTKRWRTLDLISIMKELNRTYTLRNFGYTNLVRITDRLSSLPRFKKEEYLSD